MPDSNSTMLDLQGNYLSLLGEAFASKFKLVPGIDFGKILHFFWGTVQHLYIYLDVLQRI